MEPYKKLKQDHDFDRMSMMSSLTNSKIKFDYDYIVKCSCTENPTKLTLPRIQSFDQQKKWIQIIHIDLICISTEQDIKKALLKLPSTIQIHSPLAQGCADLNGSITTQLEYASLKNLSQIGGYTIAQYATNITDMDKASMKVSASQEIKLEFYYQQPYKEKGKLWSQPLEDFVAQDLILTLRIENEEEK